MASPDALRGHVDAMLLSVLADGPVHGYGAIERIRDRSGGALDFPSGTVYPALKRLERRGLIEGEWESSGRSKRVYRLTPAGTSELEAQRTEWTATASIITSVLGAARA
ncbi:winged helix DNA-binding protein [Agrococcus sediminis]|jgi:DNA-binding PadR family transcriptional regulator|uniref:Winged helix DNA-binding protein n=1 Tax=Agrococcus sediminis TaxID=2599924 RepID=A0A5M8QA87_9MICO|nr:MULTISPECIES: helix-turn-helix transcriptional regulator [Agrococcus]KAA6432849.1 winged helix DNA-binding protein [Agrococcus sediminis]MDR7234128.1 DNA-binding PadR family transcriptional regulator [Agrococcus sp. BE272]RWR20014.1 PadR family transcriptional regulator [Agrococcus lahaulensis]UOW01067.1 helix-turn-helix transcriptional regulator [Agrococcus sp. SCSIO52902]